MSSRSASASSAGRSAAYRGGSPGTAPRDAEVDELADAVLDVQPQPAERLHQRLDVEALVGARAQVAQDAGAQRRLHERAEPCLEVRRLGRAAAGAAALARRALKVRSSIVGVTLSAGQGGATGLAARGVLPR